MSSSSANLPSHNVAFVESLFDRYKSSPESVPEEWRRYFEGWSAEDPALMEGAAGRGADGNGNGATPGLFDRRFGPAGGVSSDELRIANLQDRVNQLVRNYRMRGHMIARIDPLGLPRRMPPELEVKFFGFSDEDLDRRVTCRAFQYEGPLTLREIIRRLQNTYCRSIGVEYMHIGSLAIRRWLQRRMEGTENRLAMRREDQLRILTRLTDAVTFEEFIQKKYLGAKSFSLQGCESLIPLLDLAIETAGGQGVREIVLGMAHRGRLNVLANILGKHPRQIFREFEDADPDRFFGGGDVKYHLGHSTDWKTAGGGKVHLSLCFNPSHLEFVNPVVLGRVRAKQDRVGDADRETCMALLIHGDAAFAGEGIVQESLALSELGGYAVGGALHVIVNNQIGFTTSPEDGRSGMYASDVAKMLQVPIFHVNGEDPEAVAQVVQLAMDFRRTFRRDVVIDMYGYRRFGHNESDEPSFTQPLLYRAIANQKSVREGYLDHLLKLGGVTREEADRIADHRREELERALEEARRPDYRYPEERRRGIWRRKSFAGGSDVECPDVDTGVAPERLSDFLRRLSRVPEGFHPHPKIRRWLQAREGMAAGEMPLDWAAAEALALATLLDDGVPVRFSGQDCERGTFSHRHAVLHDFDNGSEYVPLRHLRDGQAELRIFNSPLAEGSVLGFEYGYSLDCPDGLVLWEAQFGDFVNAAQVIIDQFISSAEDKWNRLSGLVLLLPHGFEGMGPEHSSARLERFLTLAAEDNMQVVSPTTPAQIFHCLRRQVTRPWRKPLVVMSPKSLLRHPQAVSGLSDLASGPFRRVIDDAAVNPDEVRRVVLCSGKVYFELLARREELGRGDVALVRLEQFYPLPGETLRQVVDRYPERCPVVWVQEEPENMGAWRFLRAHLGDRPFGRRRFTGVSRPASASPATGSHASHRLEQARLLEAAFAKRVGVC